MSMFKIKQLSLEKMCYRNDKLSFSLTLLGLLVNVFYFFTLYRNNGNFYYTYEMGLSVIYNLIFMLVVFLSAEEIKIYRRGFSLVIILVGILQILRMFYYPKEALNANVLSQNQYTIISIYLIVSAAFLIIAGIISFIKSTLLINYKKNQQNGVGE